MREVREKRVIEAFYKAINSPIKRTLYNKTIKELLFTPGYDDDGRDAGLDELLGDILKAI